MNRRLTAAALLFSLAAPALADHGADLTLYHSNDAALFKATGGSVDGGHAVIHETRRLDLQKGDQQLIIGNLPDYLDPEAVDLNFPSSHAVSEISHRLLLPRGANGTLTGHIGKQVTVYGNNGQSLAQGTLAGIGSDGSLIISGDVFGPTLVHDYAAVKLTAGHIGGGARLQVNLHSETDGHVTADLTYPTAGLGWRAAYSGTLEPGHACRMQFDAEASLANRSGRAWNDARIKLVAGKPFFARQGAPRPVMMAAAQRQNTPQQGTLGDYRTFTLPDRVDLPDDSITQSPLYKPHTLDCQRSWVYENGSTWQPPQPITRENFGNDNHDSVTGDIRFTAFDTLPAGYLRVLTVDKDGHAEFLGEGQVDDTPKGAPVTLALGQAFDLKGARQRTAFKVDEAGHFMDESFRVTLTNSGGETRTVTVVEHPNRWQNWTLAASSIAPSQTDSDTITFRVEVPANGQATLDYTVHYSWTATDMQ